MPPSPVIVFSAFRSLFDPRLQGWAKFREHLQDSARVAEVVSQGISEGISEAHRARQDRSGASLSGPTGVPAQSGIWRLLAANNREIGRSSSLYSSFARARAHVLQLQARVGDLTVTSVNGPTAGTHGWYIALDGVAVMTSGRWYGAAASSLEAAAGTIEAFRHAVVAADAHHLAGSGRRGHRVLTDEEKALAW